jgi:hypothetical protein
MLSRCALTRTSSISITTFRTTVGCSDRPTHFELKGRIRAMVEPKIVETAYGSVDATVLKELKHGFFAPDLLKAADSIDAQRLWLRSSLLRLHGMAHHVIDGAPLTVTSTEPIWQLAEEIADQLDTCVTVLSNTSRLVDQLGRLRPPDH